MDEKAKPSLVFLHTVTPLIALFDQIGNSRLPGIRRLHVLDEPLLERVRQQGAAADRDLQALKEHLQAAVDIGAAGMLVTCSTLSPVVDRLADQFPMAVFRIDDRLVQESVRQGARVGVVATNEATLTPTRQRLEAQAQAAGKTLVVHMRLVAGAFAALQSGDFERHDQLVWQAVTQLAGQVDVITLAQASMARILQNPPEQALPVPVLSSPYLAMEQVREYLVTKEVLS